MLRSCSKTEFERYTDFIYALATDLTKSGYPTYCDGIKTKVEFLERSAKAFVRDTEHMLLFEHESEVQGMIHYFWVPEDQYLQTICFNINKATEQAIAEFLTYVSKRFKGYDAFLRFPAENNSAVNYLSGQGFECIEKDFNNTAFLDRFDDLRKTIDLIQIKKENYELFESLHRQTEGYWNSERMLADLDNWIIIGKETDGILQGAVYYRALALVDGWFEIYGIDMRQGDDDSQLFKELLNAALIDAKHRNGRFMTFFCEEEYEKAAMECGFLCVGNNLCYKAHLE
ncbi:MAG: hypothetical protein IK141_01515 [Clostridia bacterium]|nr:hypothetical protein [Clostridia bacterium]